MKRSWQEKTFSFFNIIFMLILLVITLYPYLNQLAISLNDGADTMMGGITIFPRKFTLENYRTVFVNKNFTSALFISVTRVLLASTLSLAVVFSAAYALTRRGLPYKRGITLYLMIPSYISAGMIPVFILYRYIHLINHYGVYILPGVFVFYNMVIIRSFLQELPPSLEESAKIDGATDLQIMIKIIMPISLPVLATVALWLCVGNWNDWTTTLLYITDKKLYPLQYLMMRLIKDSALAQEMAKQSTMSQSGSVARPTPDSVKAATLIVTTIPIIMTYPFFQKYFITGVTLGAVKE